jgi:hypothetical protein
MDGNSKRENGPENSRHLDFPGYVGGRGRVASGGRTSVGSMIIITFWIYFLRACMSMENCTHRRTVRVVAYFRVPMIASTD